MDLASHIYTFTQGNAMVTVRMVAVDDLPRVIALFDEYRSFYGQEYDIRLAERFIHARFDLQDSWILVAKDTAGRAVGFCQIYPGYSSVSACRIGILNDLFVAAGARSRGIGSALLAAAEALAMSLGLARLELSTARDNHVARMLYSRHGWLPDEAFIGYQKAIISPSPGI